MVVGVQVYPLTGGQMGDNLVDVHVGLRAAAGLPDHQRKFVIPFALSDLLAGAGNGLGLLGGNFPKDALALAQASFKQAKA